VSKHSLTVIGFADTCVFELFSWNLIRGNPATALNGTPQRNVITEEMASKYFGDEDPMGQTLTFENALDFVITGVMESIPAQSHFNVNFMASMLTMERINPHLMTNWGNHGDSYVPETYIRRLTLIMFQQGYRRILACPYRGAI
jgi:hypothetical protein